MWKANAVFFFCLFVVMGLCKTLNFPAQEAKSRGGILVVRALCRTILTIEIDSQYNQEKDKKKGRLESFGNDYILM